MQILSLDLENVKSYDGAHIDFAPGVNAIVGSNGAGKSTILEAIGFTLFDHLGYKQQDFVREGKSTATITVTFLSSLDERRYQAVRKCGSSNQHYIHDPELDARICEGKADVLTFLRGHMGVEPGADLARLFSDAVGVPQGAFTAAFLLTPALRKGTFDPLLQVDEYKRAFDALREPLNLLKTRNQEFAVEAAGLEARLEQLPELEAESKTLAAELEQIAATLAELEAGLTRITGTRVELEAQQAAVRTLQQQQATLTERSRAADQRLQHAVAALTAAQAAAETVAAQQPGHDAYVAAQAEERELDAQVLARQALRDRLNAAERTLALTRSKLETLVQEREKAAAAAARVAQLAPSVAEQERVEAELAAAQQADARRQELVDQLAAQEKGLAELETRAAGIAQQLAGAEAFENEQQSLEETLAGSQTALDEFKRGLARMSAEADALKEQSAALQAAETAACPVCEQPLTEEHRVEMLTRNEARLVALRAEYKAGQAAIQTGESEREAANTRLAQVRKTLRRLPRAEELSAIRSEIEQRDGERTELARRVHADADAAGRIAVLKEQLTALGNPKEQRAVAASQAARKDALEQEQQALDSTSGQEEAAVTALVAQLEAFIELDDAVARVATALDEHGAAYQAVLSRQALAATIDERTAENEAAQAELSALAEAVENAAQELAAAEAGFDAETYAATVSREQELRAELTTLQTRRTMLGKEQDRNEARLTLLREQAEALAAIHARQKELTNQEEVLSALRAILREAGPYITATLIRQVSADAARIFSDLMQDYSRHLTWTEEYEIRLNVDGNERQFGQLSGGEQMSAALAVRLALLREMSNIDIAFFDEPTTNLDEARRDALARQIVNIKGLRQLFVISHDDTFEQATQNLIRVDKSGGVSRVVG
ncbi:MAG: SMC family ATPase [Caldilineaceae bacterium]|nr:SMC family ATPase [Caldilineaceae bacterium]